MIETIEKTDDFGNKIKIVYNFDESICRVYDDKDVLKIEFNIIENVKKILLYETKPKYSDGTFYKILKHFNGYYDKNSIKYILNIYSKTTFFKNYIYYDGVLYNYKFEKILNIDINIENVFDKYIIVDNKMLDLIDLKVVYEHERGCNIEYIFDDNYIISKTNDNKKYLFDIKNNTNIVEIVNLDLYDIVENISCYGYEDKNIYKMKMCNGETILYFQFTNILFQTKYDNLKSNHILHSLDDDNNIFLILKFDNEVDNVIIVDSYNNILFEDKYCMTHGGSSNYTTIHYYNKHEITLNHVDLLEESKRLQNLKILLDDRNN